MFIVDGGICLCRKVCGGLDIGSQTQVCLFRAHVDGGEFLQQFLIRIGGRVDLHQSVSRIEKLCWRHGKHLVHGNKVIFLL